MGTLIENAVTVAEVSAVTKNTAAQVTADAVRLNVFIAEDWAVGQRCP